MRKMKDSGIAWIGSIPSYWDQHPVYYFFSERKVPNVLLSESNLLSLSYGKIKKKDINTNEGLLPSSFNTYNIIEEGDIIIRPTDLQNDKRSLRTALCNEHGIITSAYIALRPKSGVNSVYFYYLLHACDVQKVFYNMGNGVRQGLNYSELSKLMLLVPPYNEQLTIASFLDSKCAEIDALMEDIQAEISTLEEYKKSIITKTVIKGLNPDAEMKDSGIAWVGKCPAHWQIKGNKYIMHKIKHIHPLYQGEDILSLSMKGVIVRDLEAGGKMPTSFNGYQLLYPGNLLMCLFDYDVTPRCIGLIKNYGVSSPAYSQFELDNENVATYFYYYYLMVDNEKSILHLAKNLRHSFTETQLGNIAVPVPPVEEQHAIAHFLDTKCAEIEDTIAEKQRQLAIIEEYKKSLIYEYVTGKKEVPTP